MAIAVNQLTGAKVALFYNSKFVYTFSEAKDLRLSLTSLGHVVDTYDGISSPKFSAAVDDADVLHIPALASRRYRPTEAVEYEMRKFVRDGGTLVINNAAFSDNETDFINRVFNTSIVELDNPDNSNIAKTAGAVGTTFGGDPATLSDNFYTSGWLTSSLPQGAVTVYSNGLGGSTVVVFQHGRGQVVMLGWDWDNAVPNGAEDGGWLQVLHSAMSKTNGLPTGSIINGGAGDDVVSTSQTILGQPFATPFDDIVSLGDGNDKADTGAGDDWIAGGKGKDKLNGGAGDDVLSGGADNDTLRGGPGVDDFLFDVKLSKAGVDKLPDFKSGVDHLVLSRSVFKSLDEGILTKKELNKYFDVSNKGVVSYDAGKQSIPFAKIPGDETLKGDDIIVTA